MFLQVLREFSNHIDTLVTYTAMALDPYQRALKERLLKKKKQKKSRGKYNKEYVEGVATILHTYYCDLKTWNKLSPKKKKERNGKRLKYLAEIDTGKRKYLPPGIWKKNQN